MKELLILLAAGGGGWFILSATGVVERLRGCVNIHPLGADELIRSRDAVVIDVREADEYAGSRIPGAEHIPLRQIKSRISELESYRERPIVINCRSGSRSAKACVMLRKSGFEAYNIKGGVMGWARADLTLEN